ncbi:MAG: hypothetical protein COV36_03025 [Alphaproteobacteria bacterium CG11_big_fil_rev_8_21_14_0_20_44_7]|nr:MAG: hypothetical protein COV36_03025 [Alphaproteobacteria bacterium CG11_big_fil_rev_8_21_14_0_20_44_7]
MSAFKNISSTGSNGDNPLTKKVYIAVLAALALAVLANLPITNQFFPFNLIFAIGTGGRAICHELGHAFFGWVFGQISIPTPMLTFPFEREIMVQLVFNGGLLFFAYWLRDKSREACYGIIAFVAVMGLISLTPYYEYIGLYMGQGGEALMGGILLYIG